MPARRKVSPRQIELLVNFAESHRDIALGRLAGGPLGSQSTRQVWNSITTKLNAVADGFTKTPEQWRRYWIEFKAKVKTKAADSRRNASATGGGPSKLAPLNEVELRVLGLIGSVAVEGETDVRLPSNIPTDETESEIGSHPVTTQSIPQPTAVIEFLEPAMEVEWLEGEFPLPEPQSLVPSTSADTLILPTTSTPQILPPPEDEEVETVGHPQRSRSGSRRRMKRAQRLRRDEMVPRWASTRIDASLLKSSEQPP